MQNKSDALLFSAIQFLFTYFKFKDAFPQMLPVFCEHMPDDELLIRIMVKEKELLQFSEEFNHGSNEKVLNCFCGIIQKIENEVNCSLNEWNDEKFIIN